VCFVTLSAALEQCIRDLTSKVDQGGFSPHQHVKGTTQSQMETPFNVGSGLDNSVLGQFAMTITDLKNSLLQSYSGVQLHLSILCPKHCQMH